MLVEFSDYIEKGLWQTKNAGFAAPEIIGVKMLSLP
jgi:hypothetical protein